MTVARGRTRVALLAEDSGGLDRIVQRHAGILDVTEHAHQALKGDRARGDDQRGRQPGEGPRALIDWSSHAHAELFVATRQLDAQRERIIREANELATMLLGESTYGSTTAQILARVEAHWTSSPGQVSESR